MSGEKRVETRHYPLPQKYLRKPLALIETPGMAKFKSRIIGVIIFDASYQYKSKDHWQSEMELHRIEESSSRFGYVFGKPKWGWRVQDVFALKQTVEPPKPRGIVFAGKCVIPPDVLSAKDYRTLASFLESGSGKKT